VDNDISDHIEVLRGALRLFFIINAAAEKVPDVSAAPSDAVGVVHAEKRIQALDFWVRNPDYLAEELMDEYVAGRRPDGRAIVRMIFEKAEPDLRRIAMVRFRYGAREPLDEALSILESRNLVRMVREGSVLDGVQENHYYLTERGRDVAARLVADYPVLTWYHDRTRIVAELALGQSATQLKDRQYQQDEYAGAPHNTLIPPITDRVRRRFEKLEVAQ
jgi:hypothetical protein